MHTQYANQSGERGGYTNGGRTTLANANQAAAGIKVICWLGWVMLGWVRLGLTRFGSLVG